MKTADTVANAVALAKATRKARNTMGKNQKKKVKGTLVAPAVPAAPAEGAGPAKPVAKANGAQAPALNGAAQGS